MIPKVIHYIWLGGNPLPEMVVKCMESWKKFCPDYEIKRWDETNLNLDINTYCRQAYDAKKYAFASDVLRYYVVKEHGGIYLDVDVELLKPLDDLLENKAFMGFEMSETLFVNPGLILGAEPHNKVVTEIFNKYENDTFIKPNGQINYETVCMKTTDYLQQNYGLKIENTVQDLGDVKVYSTEYFCPLHACTKENLYQTENTHSKHLYLASWVPKQTFLQKIKSKCIKIIKKIIGKKNVQRIRDRRKRKQEKNNGL